MEKLKNILPIRIILRPSESGFEGYIENSFSMGWSDTRVHIFWSGQAVDNLGGRPIIDGVRSSEYNFKDLPKEYKAQIYDPLSDDCPVIIDWNAWLSATNKYNSRNAPFQVKGSMSMSKETDAMNQQEGEIKDSVVISHMLQTFSKVIGN